MNPQAPSQTVSLGRVGWHAQPFVAVFTAAATGLVVDRCARLPLEAWLACAGSGLLGWLVLWWRGRCVCSACLLLGAVGCLGAAWHHHRWNLFDADELGRAATDVARPACVEVVALTSPRRVAAPRPNPLCAIPVGDRSVLTVRVLQARDGARWRPASGESELTVDGHLLGVTAGDRLRVLALFFRPPPQRNPGELDRAWYSRTERLLFELDAESPDAVTRVARGSLWDWRRLLAIVRDRGHEHLDSHLRTQPAELANAVLLGAREQVPWERTQAFVTTGTVHLLSISGLHVGILAVGFWWVTRLLAVRRATAIWAAALFVVVYALLTDARPPVLRAAVLIVAFCAARLAGRRTSGYNVLAGAALVVLVWNPLSLFQAGTQLSFLAVATIYFVTPHLARATPDDPLSRLIAQTRPWYVRAARHLVGSVGVFVAISAAIWFVTLPLTMYRYHLISPIAIILNPIVAVPMAVALFSGFGVLVFGWIAPPAAHVCGWICDASLGLLEETVRQASQMRLGYLWVAGPAGWWVIGFYVGLALYLGLLRGRLAGRWCLAALAAWFALGAVTGNDRPAGWPLCPEPRLTCTFVSVGHGACVAVQLPEGQTVLYDAGHMGLPELAGQSIAATLWSQGITHLDAIILSHADTDHYNAIPDLLERFSVGVVYVSPVMFDEETEALQALRAAVEGSGVPLEELYGGDRLQVRGGATLEILHPPRRGILGGDNANSIVLQIEYAGRRILLAGDLESPGLDDVLAEEPTDCDVILAPHHGSLASNPVGFVEWSRPEWVVVSGAASQGIGPVERAYARSEARVFHTAKVGAVQVTIEMGRIAVRDWRGQPW